MDKDKLSRLLKDAQIAHHEYETMLGHADENWADWYAQFVLDNIGSVQQFGRLEENCEGFC